MSKINHVFTAFSVALIPFLTKPALALPSVQGSSRSVLQKSASDGLFCYFQMQDGRILDLRHLCGRKTVDDSTYQSGSSANSNTPVPSSYNPNSNTPVPSSYNPNSNTPVPSSYNPNSNTPVPNSYNPNSNTPVPSSYNPNSN